MTDLRRLVVVDIDDTLYLEREYVKSGFMAVSGWADARLGVSGFGDRAWGEFVAGRRGDIFDRVLRSFGLLPSTALVAKLVAIYRGHVPSISVLDDARAFLDGVVGRANIGVVSDGPVRSQRAKGDALGLDRWASRIVLTEALGPEYRKPAPLAFASLQDAFHATSEDCVYVADNPSKDFGGPKALGWRTVRVRRVEGLHAEVPGGDDIDHEIESMDGLDVLLKS
jgi:putative hydrolase of the HAD superfamily